MIKLRGIQFGIGLLVAITAFSMVAFASMSGATAKNRHSPISKPPRVSLHRRASGVAAYPQ
jgi:hypothetical protein